MCLLGGEGEAASVRPGPNPILGVPAAPAGLAQTAAPTELLTRPSAPGSGSSHTPAPAGT